MHGQNYKLLTRISRTRMYAVALSERRDMFPGPVSPGDRRVRVSVPRRVQGKILSNKYVIKHYNEFLQGSLMVVSK